MKPQFEDTYFTNGFIDTERENKLSSALTVFSDVASLRLCGASGGGRGFIHFYSHHYPLPGVFPINVFPRNGLIDNTWLNTNKTVLGSGRNRASKYTLVESPLNL